MVGEAEWFGEGVMSDLMAGKMRCDDGYTRCLWACSDPLLQQYHDTEWGVPERNSRALWEKLMLDGFQAGLSWRLILARRDAFRVAFSGFVPERVAAYTQKDVERLVTDARIIRSRAKIEAVIGNARAYLAMQDKGEEFSDFVWGLAGGRSVAGDGSGTSTRSTLGDTLSAALKERGFRFAGPVIVHAWAQATGLINDHHASCFCRPVCEKQAALLNV